MPRIHATTDRGASIVEYALLIALISTVAMGALKLLGNSTAEAYDEATAAFDGDAGENEPPSGPGPSDPPSGPPPGGGGEGGGGGGGGAADDDADVGGESEENEDDDDGSGPGGGGEEGPGDDPGDDAPGTAGASFPHHTAARNGNGNTWNVSATLVVTGTDGASAQATVRVVERGTDGSILRTSTRTVQVTGGSATIGEPALRYDKPNKNHPVVDSITYEVISVKVGGVDVGFDGTPITIDRP